MSHELRNLSDAELIAQTEQLVAREREATEQIVRHLAEIDTRRLFATLGYSSLYDYARRGLNYSESAALRRIKAARAGNLEPKVFDLMKSGEMTLATAGIVYDLRKTQDATALVNEVRGKSQQEAERAVAKHRPVEPKNARDKIKPVVVQAKHDVKQSGLAFGEADQTSNDLRPNAQLMHQISFMAPAELMELLGLAQKLLFKGRREDASLVRVFTAALKLLIAKMCPKERLKRRTARQEKKGK